jgi:hypothetical protein
MLLRSQRNRNNGFPELPDSHYTAVTQEKDHHSGDQPGVCTNQVLHEMEKKVENTLKGMYKGIKNLGYCVDEDLKNVE